MHAAPSRNRAEAWTSLRDTRRSWRDAQRGRTPATISHSLSRKRERAISRSVESIARFVRRKGRIHRSCRLQTAPRRELFAFLRQAVRICAAFVMMFLELH
jgi:hypothetical protein